MEQKNITKGKKKLDVEELLKYPQQIERELQYWIKERKVSYMEKAIKANDMNTRFAGTVSIESMDMLNHPDDDSFIDLMYEDDKELIENFEEIIDLYEKDDEIAEAG